MPKLNPWLRVFTPREDLRKNRPVDTSEGRSGPPIPGYDLPPLRGSNQLPRRLVRTESADPAVLCDLRSPSPRPLARHLETYGRSNGGVWRPSPNEPYRFTPHAPRPTPHAPRARPGVRPETLVAGEPMRCRCRIWIHRGRPDAEHLARAFAAYLA